MIDPMEDRVVTYLSKEERAEITKAKKEASITTAECLRRAVRFALKERARNRGAW